MPRRQGLRLTMSSGASNNRHFGIRGLPKACVCGRPIVLWDSKTQDNPGRPFYKCETQRNDHYFRWVEECMLEEIQDVVAKIEKPEFHIGSSSSDLAGMKKLVQHLSNTTKQLSRDVKRLKIIAISSTGLLASVIAAIAYFNFR
ncbi:unnamed protein product [Microthlaspi erraticum]|uniref:GRF-type domain-containing protein n=1 Tax=Microthlaspi erraticum TaxID=1685480 RepID=A0A6D2LBY0_9BRAS|nr:unnamed protein product [Microthlaspi erraticum]